MDKVRCLLAQGLSNKEVRKELRECGYKAPRISQLIKKAMVPIPQARPDDQDTPPGASLAAHRQRNLAMSQEYRSRFEAISSRIAMLETEIDTELQPAAWEEMEKMFTEAGPNTGSATEKLRSAEGKLRGLQTEQKRIAARSRVCASRAGGKTLGIQGLVYKRDPPKAKAKSKAQPRQRMRVTCPLQAQCPRAAQGIACRGGRACERVRTFEQMVLTAGSAVPTCVDAERGEFEAAVRMRMALNETLG